MSCVESPTHVQCTWRFVCQEGVVCVRDDNDEDEVLKGYWNSGGRGGPNCPDFTLKAPSSVGSLFLFMLPPGVICGHYACAVDLV